MDEETAKTFQRALPSRGSPSSSAPRSPRAKAGDKAVELTVEPVAGGAAETLKADYVLVWRSAGVRTRRAWAWRASA